LKRHAAIDPGTDRHEHDQPNGEIHEKFFGGHSQLNASCRMFKQDGFLSRRAVAAISPARPESAKTASSPMDAPCPKPGRSGPENDAGRLFQHPQVIAYAMGSTTPACANPSRRITQLSHRPQA
jgi:hypothetical protein